MTRQRYFVGGEVWEAEADPSTPVYLAGRRMYTITTIGGAIRPFGAEHIKGKMGGVWAHPFRVLHGWALALEHDGRATPLEDAASCELFGSHVTRRFQVGELLVEWTEFVAEDVPRCFSSLIVRNLSASPAAAALLVRAEPDLRGCWFGGMPEAELRVDAGRGEVRWSAPGPYDGIAVALALEPPADWRSEAGALQARLPIELAPGEALAVELRLTVEEVGKELPPARLAGVTAISEKIAHYRRLDEALVLETPDLALDQAWRVARQNLQMLVADYPPALSTYLLAGLPEYPQLFGCDTAYSVGGAVAAGFGEPVQSALRELARYGWRGCGRIPHEITTNGRVFNPGNIQETPQFAVACWDFVRWTGDLAFLAEIYPLCVEGLEHFGWTLAGRGYPVGDGVVERFGMGACKLDSVCYLHQALVALREMALTLGRADDAEAFGLQAARLAERFERDWWVDAEGMYADSLHLDGRPQFDGHWTVVLPAQTGIARPERARSTLDRIEREWLNEWGLVHTRGAEPRVWTLPTGLLALAALRDGRADLALRLLRSIGETARHGTLGTLKELIPLGLCFIQLWSAGLLLQGVVEGLLGVSPLAHRHEVLVEPRLPSSWPEARIRGLRVGAHTIDLLVAPGRVELRHTSGPRALTLRARATRGEWQTVLAAPGATVRTSV